MAKIDVVCPRCSETQGVIRNGHSTSGAQLYRCKLCLKTFQLSFQYNAAKPDTHQSIIDMAMNGAGCRDTARVLDISLNTVLRHLKNWRRNRLRNTLSPEQKLSSVVKLMSSGHSYVVRAIHAGSFMPMTASESGFLLTSLAPEMR